MAVLFALCCLCSVDCPPPSVVEVYQAPHLAWGPTGQGACMIAPSIECEEAHSSIYGINLSLNLLLKCYIPRPMNLLQGFRNPKSLML